MIKFSKKLIITAGLGLLLTPLLFWPQSQNLSLLLTQAYLVVLGLLGVLGLALLWPLQEISWNNNWVSWGLLAFVILFLIGSIGAGTLWEPIKSYSLLTRGTGAEVLIASLLALVVVSMGAKSGRKLVSGLFTLSSLVSIGALLALLEVSIFPVLFSGETPLIMNINQAGLFAGLALVIGMAVLTKQVRLFKR
mgnify:CR=1 FL=1